MTCSIARRPRPCTPDRPTRDRGAVDTSVEMLFGLFFVLVVCLTIFEAVAYWHARNVFDDAASEGARVAAAYDGDCDAGIAAARREIAAHSSSWARDVSVGCIDGPTVTITVVGTTPGVLGDALGIHAQVVELAPKEQ